MYCRCNYCSRGGQPSGIIWILSGACWLYQLSTSCVSLTTDHINFSMSAIQKCSTNIYWSEFGSWGISRVCLFLWTVLESHPLCKTQHSPILWLMVFSWMYNNILSIHHSQFCGMKNLEELDLKYCAFIGFKPRPHIWNPIITCIWSVLLWVPHSGGESTGEQWGIIFCSP
jgi:hypothetical protein